MSLWQGSLFCSRVSALLCRIRLLLCGCLLVGAVHQPGPVADLQPGVEEELGRAGEEDGEAADAFVEQGAIGRVGDVDRISGLASWADLPGQTGISMSCSNVYCE